MLLHVLGHINADHAALIVKKSLCQSLGQLRLAHPRGAQEDEGTDGTVGVLDAGPGPQDSFTDSFHCLVLAHYPLMEHIFQMNQLLPLAREHLGHGDARPAAHHLGDIFLAHFFLQELLTLGTGGDSSFLLLQGLLQLGQLAVFQLRQAVQVIGPLSGLHLAVHLVDLLLDGPDPQDSLFLAFPLGLQFLLLLLELGLFLTDALQFFPGSLVSLLVQSLLLDFQLHDLAAQFIQRPGHRLDFRAHLGSSLIHQVDGLVRQEPVGNIPVRQSGCRHQSRITDAHPVMHLIALLEPAQDGDGILHAGLAHQHRLEAALQCGILLDILPVFIEGSGANAAQLPPGQHGFQDIARIHGPLGGTCPHYRVHLVDEEKDLPVGLGNFIQHAFEPFLEFPTELGACHQSTHIQGIEGLVLQGFRHVPCHNAAGQPLHNGGLAHARLTDEHRVVLGAAGEDFDGPPDFLITPNHWVQLAMAGQVREVPAVFLQRLVALLRIVTGDILLAVLLDGILYAALGELELPADGLHLF